MGVFSCSHSHKLSKRKGWFNQWTWITSRPRAEDAAASYQTKRPGPAAASRPIWIAGESRPKKSTARKAAMPKKAARRIKKRKAAARLERSIKCLGDAARALMSDWASTKEGGAIPSHAPSPPHF